MRSNCANTGTYPNPPTTGCDKYTPAKCIYYSGASLQCSGVLYNDTIDAAIRKLDNKICSTVESIVPSGRFMQFVIGDAASAIAPGQDSFVFYEPYISKDSVWITKGGSELPRGLDDQSSYNVTYGDDGKITVQFNEPVKTGNVLIIHYLYNVTSQTGGGGGGGGNGSSMRFGIEDNVIDVDRNLTVSNLVGLNFNDDEGNELVRIYRYSNSGQIAVKDFSNNPNWEQVHISAQGIQHTGAGINRKVLYPTGMGDDTYMPVSVNGFTADPTGNIVIPGGGGTSTAGILKLRVGTGTVNGTFDYFVPPGNTITCPELAGKRLNYVIHNGNIYQDFNAPILVTQSGTNLNFVAGVSSGDYLIIHYQ